jgi:conjugal transfer/entry exclusion protein
MACRVGYDILEVVTNQITQLQNTEQMRMQIIEFRFRNFIGRKEAI